MTKWGLLQWCEIASNIKNYEYESTVLIGQSRKAYDYITDTEKTFDRIQYPFMKNSKKNRNWGSFFNLIKSSYKKILQSVFKDEELECFPPAFRSKGKHICCHCFIT